MSRKKQKQLPIDTGGLDLNLPTSVPAALGDLSVPVPGDLLESTAHKAVEELETLPPSQSLSAVSGLPYFQTPGDCDNGLPLMEAVHNTLLFLAVRKTNVAGVLIVSNGQRFWTVNDKNLEPMLAEGVLANAGLRNARVWRPVLGNERGWYVG